MTLMPLNELPKLPELGWMGSFGFTTQERISLQQTLAKSSSPMLRGRVLHLNVVMPCTPDAAHEVLVTKAKSFEKSPGLRVLLYYLAGQGLFTSEGDLWRSQRRLMAPIFQPAPMHQYAETMRLVAERSADAMSDGMPIDVAHETTRIAMSVVGKALFDTDTFDEADELGSALTACLSWANKHLGSPGLVAHVLMLDALDAVAQRTQGRVKLLATDLHRRVNEPFLLSGARSPELQQAAQSIDHRVQQMIDERRKHGLERKDLLTRLLTAQDQEQGGGRMTDKQVRDEAITLFIAGHETTATALAWAFYLLARHPNALAKARAEADAFGDGPITQWHPEKLAYCTRVFREAMRMYPPIMFFPKRALEDVEICGYQIPKKTLVFVSSYAQHYREDNFENPTEFDPDRWLPEHEASRHRSSYLPFSAGPRVCIGMHFAMMEGPIVLATLLRRWQFEIDPHKTIHEDDFATLRPKGGVPAIVRRRDPSTAH
jgi:cytochrome P450